VLAQPRMRVGVHSACFWCEAGMWRGSVVWRPGTLLRRCDATRVPRWNSSTVVAVDRPHSSSCTSVKGAE